MGQGGPGEAQGGPGRPGDAILSLIYAYGVVYLSELRVSCSVKRRTVRVYFVRSSGSQIFKKDSARILLRKWSKNDHLEHFLGSRGVPPTEGGPGKPWEADFKPNLSLREALGRPRMPWEADFNVDLSYFNVILSLI